MPNLPPIADVLVLGQGLAGSTLAWRLVDRGLSVVVVDRDGVDEQGRPTASRVAAGLITPVTGKRLTVADDFAEHWESARAFYLQIEAQTGCPLLEEKPAVRILRDEEERRLLTDRGHDAHAVAATSEEVATLGLADDRLSHGAFVMPRAARLDVPAYLQATAAWLGDRLVRAECHPRSELTFEANHVAVRSLGIHAQLAVLCQGHSAPPLPWLDGVRFSPAKGEVLTVRSRSLRSERVIHNGVWIAPEGKGIYRVGSTAEWHRLDSKPTDEGRRNLLDRLHEAGVTDAEVLDHRAAVRPATPARRPTFGLCQHEPRVGWFNGLGAKGSLWAPWYAEQMAELVGQALR